MAIKRANCTHFGN